MFFPHGAIDDDIINVCIAPLDVIYNLADLLLEGRWRAFHSKGHQFILEQSLGCAEHRNFARAVSGTWQKPFTYSHFNLARASGYSHGELQSLLIDSVKSLSSKY